MEEQLLLVSAVALENDEIVKRRRLMRTLRDKSDPFAMQESIFVQNFRVQKSLCRDLLLELEPYDTQKSTIPFVCRFLASLFFYAHGSYQKCVGSNYHTTMSQASVSRALCHTSELIVRIKAGEIHFPQTLDELADTKKGFYTTFGIKGTIGAVDCTHVGIVSPPANDTRNPLCLYMNRKGYYSINVEAVCDHRLSFTSINAKFPGSCHDSGIWTTSPTRLHLMRNHNAQQDTWLLGDQGYPLEPWLLTPVAEPANEREIKFNKLHAKSRNTIERAFGVLKSRFRCLSKHRILHYGHERAANIIYACSILHNILNKHGAPIDIENEAEEELQNSHNSIETAESPFLIEGGRIRSRYILSL